MSPKDTKCKLVKIAALFKSQHLSCCLCLSLLKQQRSSNQPRKHELLERVGLSYAGGKYSACAALLLVPEPSQTAMCIKLICKAQLSLERMGVCLVQVPSAHVERLDLIPDVDKGQLSVLVHGTPAAKGLKVIPPQNECE